MKRTLQYLAITISACISTGATAQQYKTNGNLVEAQGAQVAMSDKNHPATLNGEKIYSGTLMATAPQYRDKDTTLRFYILSNLQPEFAALPDGIYSLNLSDIVVDKNGRIVYSRYAGVEAQGRHKATVPDDLQMRIETRLKQVIADMPQLIPARKNAVTVPFVYGSLPPAAAIEVKNHSARVF